MCLLNRSRATEVITIYKIYNNEMAGIKKAVDYLVAA